MLKYMHYQINQIYKKRIMSLFPYLELQPIDIQEDGSVSDLDKYEIDDVIDLSADTDGETLDNMWSEITKSLHEEEWYT